MKKVKETTAMKAFLLLTFTFWAYATCAQNPQCLPEEHLWRHGTSIEKLNNAFPALLQTVDGKEGDSVKIQQFNQSADGWFTQLATYLKDNGVRLSEKEPILFRMFVNKNNQVQYLIYKKPSGWKKGRNMQAQLHRQAEAFMRLNPVNFGFSGPWRHVIKLKVE